MTLITWKQEEPKPAETWADIIGVDNEAETFAAHAALLAQEKERIAAEAAARLDGLSDSELLEKWQRAASEEEARTLPARQVDAVHRFIQATPELVLNEKNQKRIDAYLNAAKLDASQPEHFDAAYRALSSRNLLDINEALRPRPAYQRHTEADLEAMSLDQLRELAEGTR